VTVQNAASNILTTNTTTNCTVFM